MLAVGGVGDYRHARHGAHTRRFPNLHAQDVFFAQTATNSFCAQPGER